MYVLHAAPDTAATIVRLVLEELGARYRIVAVDMDADEHRGAAYRRLNPSGQVPVLETPDGVLFETAAILLWLSETHGALAPLPGSSDRAAFLKWLFFTSNTLHADMRLLFYPERYTGPDPAAQAAHHGVTVARIEHHLEVLDSFILDTFSIPKEHGWLANETPCVLNVYLAVLLRWLALYPRGNAGWFDLRQYPGLGGLAEAAERRASARRVAEAEGLGHAPFSAPAGHH